MNSPPPSDGILPSSQLSDETLYRPTQENREHARQSRREKRKAVLTPRKFARFFSPRNQPTSTQSSSAQPPALAPLNDASLNARPTSQFQPAGSQGLASPHSSPIRPRKKRKVTTTRSSEAGPSSTASEGPPSTRFITFALKTDYVTSESESELPLPAPTRQPGVRLTLASNPRPSLDESAAPEASESTAPTARVLFAKNTRQTGRSESGSELLKFFRTQRPRSQEDKPDKTSVRASPPPQPVNVTLDIPDYKPKSFVKLENRGTSASLLLREMGLTSRPGRRHPRTVEMDPRYATSRFFSRKTDWDACNLPDNTQGPNANSRMVIPFSVVSSRRYPVTAVGDEEGCIRIFETNATPADQSVRAKTRVYFKVHDNAIMDLDISPDDTRLATACGDRNGKIIDPTTTQCVAELNNGHDHALRRVRFQPGRADGNVLSTCDKAGRIQIWDLRVSSAPIDAFGTVDENPASRRAGILNTIDPAHSRTVRGRSNGASVTALQWLTGREHIVLSASEVDARIKVWDTRYINRRGNNTIAAVPLSSTAVPSSHAWRDFGITSMALSGDASRLYAVCRDSTVYAYSTAHMVLGTDSVLSSNPPHQRPGQAATGHGPLYGFRHDDLDVRSFYVRCAVRTPGLGPGPELLAVGSSRGTAVLFPTDETTLRANWDRESRLANTPGAENRPAPVPRAEPPGPLIDDDIYSTGTPRRPAVCRDATGTVALVHNGTALKGGHQREVTGVSWARDGKLVTISDDMTVRHWQETPTEGHTAVLDVPLDARDLRTGRNPMKAHFAGWARVPRSWDVDSPYWSTVLTGPQPLHVDTTSLVLNVTRQ
ncbi:WD domain-containing protein [Plectosphaerella plurivora]|uniref:WD domain-containing protein n=1 Tax=Plectosphaerella plurivora TaxID=936078 RepID=A0A9P8VB92_9PEZI|nr:WD domain-containing protein [Plectosphaerella plurivora]